jgi:DNA-nicking Smr family endonuclease
MKEANSRAAALILHLHNDLSSQFLDLHGLYVDEALAALEDKLQSTTDQPVLYVITGKGLHSKGDARIKPAVISYLNSKAYRFEELPGKLKVKLA